MTNLYYEPGSFRDPAGKIFYKNGKVYRKLSETGAKRFDYLKKDNLLEELIKKEFIVKTSETDGRQIDDKLKGEKILEHEKIDFISYPFEWTFNQLKDAALFHLDFQIYLLNKNAKLIDASAYNIQFKDNKPIFIDVLSIDEYKDGEFWYAHKQFCENFFNPLLLSSRKGVSFNNWFRGNLEGIQTSDLNSLLNFFDFTSPSVFINVFMMNKLDERSKINPKKASDKVKFSKKFSKKSFINLLSQMRNFISKLKSKKKISDWDTYEENNTYQVQEEEDKLSVIKNFVDKHNPSFLVDLGCNEGKYSEYASKQKNVKVIGIDFDLNVLDRAYIKSKKNNPNFFPMYVDFSNPSSNLGWAGSERKGLQERSNFDCVIALALIHHLVIAKNIPLEDVIKWIVSFAPSGLIEFVPKEDPTAKIMMSLKGDIFKDYEEKKFETLLSKYAKIKNISNVTSTNRKIYEFNKN